MNSCIEIQDTQASTGGWFLQQVLGYDLGNNKMAALKQYFGQLVYLADNRLFYNNLPADTKNLEGSQNIIPACKQKDNQYAHLTFWYNENTHVLKVRFSVAVPYHYAQAVAGKSLSSLDKIKASLMNVFDPKWLTMALGQTVWPTPQSCFVSAMQQLGKPGASVSCGSAGSTTKADEAKEVQAEEEAERKLQAKGPTKGPIKIQAKGAVKVKGGGVNGVRTTLGGR